MMPREIWFQLEKNKRLNGWAFVLMMLMVAFQERAGRISSQFYCQKRADYAIQWINGWSHVVIEDLGSLPASSK